MSNSISEMVMISRIGRKEIKCRLLRHLAPVTIAKIERSLPISGRLNFYERNFTYILTDLVAGEEKSKLEVKRGSVAFMPAGSTICFFLKDTRSSKPMNVLGNVSSGLDILENSRRGDYIQIEKMVTGVSSQGE